MIVKDLEPVLQSALVVATRGQQTEFAGFGDLPPELLAHVVTKVHAHGDRIVLEVRAPQSTQALEANDYQFEAGF
jgi:hypothetical protein